MKSRSFLSLLILFLAVLPAWAQIAFDATTNSGAQGSATTYNWSHTTSGSDRLLVVCVSIRTGTPTTSAVSDITYPVASTPTSFTKVRHDGPQNRARSELWYLINPDTGANSITVTLTGSTPTRSIAGAISLTGADQSSPLDADNGATGNSTGPSVSVTTVADNSWVLDCLAARTASSETATVGSGQTERWNVLDGANGLRGTGSHEGPKTPAGAVTMDWTLSAGLNWAISAASFKPVASARRLMVISANHPSEYPVAFSLHARTGMSGFTVNGPGGGNERT